MSLRFRQEVEEVSLSKYSLGVKLTHTRCVQHEFVIYSLLEYIIFAMPFFFNHPFLNSFHGVGGFFSFIIVLIVVDLILRGMALWNSARNSQKGWFVGLLIFNTVGILPLIYLLFFQKKK